MSVEVFEQCACAGSGYVYVPPAVEGGAIQYKPCECLCLKCMGTGFVMVEQFSWVYKRKIEVAARCDCGSKRGSVKRMIELDIPVQYQDCIIENYKPVSRPQKSAWMAAKDFVFQYQNDGSGILFYGFPKGTGKTHLACAILRALAVKGIAGKFIDYLDFCKRIQWSYQDEKRISESELFASVLPAQVLLIDDVGTEKPSDFKDEVFYNLINDRYRNKKGLIMTTNLVFEPGLPTEKSMAVEFPGRLYSRLQSIFPAGRRVHVASGPDGRQGELQ